MKLVAWIVAAALIASPAFADQLTPEQAAYLQKIKGINDTLHPQFGDVYVSAANVTLHLGNNYYFLPQDQARNILVNAWGNPAQAASNTLGLVFPKDSHFWDPNSWAAVVTYTPAGFVGDEQHSKSDFDRAEKAIRDGEDEMNQERKKIGGEPIHFVGWAQPPAFDPVHHTIIWARDLHFGAEPQDTLNYDVRVLGRRGYLSLNMISRMSQLPQIRPAADALRATADFQVGSRYQDFDSSTDQKSELGVAGLVAAGAGVVLAQKFGLFAVAALFLKKAIVLVFAFFAGISAWGRRVFGRFFKKQQPASTIVPPPSVSDEP